MPKNHISRTTMILDFGKFKGIDIEEVPLDYMIFLSGYRMHHIHRIPTDLPAFDWVKTNKENSASCKKISQDQVLAL